MPFHLPVPCFLSGMQEGWLEPQQLPCHHEDGSQCTSGWTRKTGEARVPDTLVVSAAYASPLNFVSKLRKSPPSVAATSSWVSVSVAGTTPRRVRGIERSKWEEVKPGLGKTWDQRRKHTRRPLHLASASLRAFD